MSAEYAVLFPDVDNGRETPYSTPLTNNGFKSPVPMEISDMTDNANRTLEVQQNNKGDERIENGMSAVNAASDQDINQIVVSVKKGLSELCHIARLYNPELLDKFVDQSTSVAHSLGKKDASNLVKLQLLLDKQAEPRKELIHIMNELGLDRVMPLRSPDQKDAISAVPRTNGHASSPAESGHRSRSPEQKKGADLDTSTDFFVTSPERPKTTVSPRSTAMDRSKVSSAISDPDLKKTDSSKRDHPLAASSAAAAPKPSRQSRRTASKAFPQDELINDFADELYNAASSADEGEVVRLLDEYQDPNAESSDARNRQTPFPLLIAVREDNADIVQILLDYGADVNKVTPVQKSSALHVAAAAGAVQSLGILLSYGADKTLKNVDGKTALEITSDKEVRKKLDEWNASAPANPSPQVHKDPFSSVSTKAVYERRPTSSSKKISKVKDEDPDEDEVKSAAAEESSSNASLVWKKGAAVDKRQSRSGKFTQPRSSKKSESPFIEKLAEKLPTTTKERNSSKTTNESEEKSNSEESAYDFPSDSLPVKKKPVRKPAASKSPKKTGTRTSDVFFAAESDFDDAVADPKKKADKKKNSPTKKVTKEPSKVTEKSGSKEPSSGNKTGGRQKAGTSKSTDVGKKKSPQPVESEEEMDVDELIISDDEKKVKAKPAASVKASKKVPVVVSPPPAKPAARSPKRKTKKAAVSPPPTKPVRKSLKGPGKIAATELEVDDDVESVEPVSEPVTSKAAPKSKLAAAKPTKDKSKAASKPETPKSREVSVEPPVKKSAELPRKQTGANKRSRPEPDDEDDKSAERIKAPVLKKRGSAAAPAKVVEDSEPASRGRKVAPRASTAVVSPKKPAESVEEDSEPQATTKIMVALSTSVDAKLKGKFSDLAKKLGWGVTESADVTGVTHFVAATAPGAGETGRLVCKRTVKMLKAVLEGAWIISSDWLAECVKSKKLVPEEPYQYHGTVSKGAKGGLARARQSIAKKGEFSTITREDFEQLITGGGGKLCKVEPTKRRLTNPSKEKLDHAATNSNLATCHYMILTEAQPTGQPLLEHGCASVSATWVLDSVELFKLQDAPVAEDIEEDI